MPPAPHPLPLSLRGGPRATVIAWRGPGARSGEAAMTSGSGEREPAMDGRNGTGVPAQTHGFRWRQAQVRNGGSGVGARWARRARVN